LHAPPLRRVAAYEDRLAGAEDVRDGDRPALADRECGRVVVRDAHLEHGGGRAAAPGERAARGEGGDPHRGGAVVDRTTSVGSCCLITRWVRPPTRSSNN